MNEAPVPCRVCGRDDHGLGEALMPACACRAYRTCGRSRCWWQVPQYHREGLCAEGVELLPSRGEGQGGGSGG